MGNEYIKCFPFKTACLRDPGKSNTVFIYLISDTPSGDNMRMIPQICDNGSGGVACDQCMKNLVDRVTNDPDSLLRHNKPFCSWET